MSLTSLLQCCLVSRIGPRPRYSNTGPRNAGCTTHSYPRRLIPTRAYSFLSAPASPHHVAVPPVFRQDRVSAGAPTALAAGAVIVVGTSHGLCLVFETHEAMRYCLGDSRSGQQLGAVSCLHLSPDSARSVGAALAGGEAGGWEARSVGAARAGGEAGGWEARTAPGQWGRHAQVEGREDGRPGQRPVSGGGTRRWRGGRMGSSDD